MAQLETQTNSGPVNQRAELRRCLRSLGGLLAVFAVLYAFFYAIHTRFPYVETGAVLVKRAKREMARSGAPFAEAPAGALKVMTFGNSKTLSGFMPALFDRVVAEGGVSNVFSVNYGLPGDERFVGDLETMAQRGVAPDVALLIIPWTAADEPGPTFFQFVRHEREIMDQLFPFRHLPRDSAIMFIEAHGSPGRFSGVYHESKRIVEQVQTDRGYYFIARQSHYANDELPPDFRSPGDTPNVPFERTIPAGPVRDRLLATLSAHHVRTVFIPTYYRENEFAAPAPMNAKAAAGLSDHPNVEIVGPDCLRFPNNLFSDATHLNPRGAEVYTRAIAGLVVPRLKQPSPAQPPPSKN